MILRKRVCAAVILCILNLFSTALQARCATVSFVPDLARNGGIVMGRLSLAKIGNIAIPRGRAYFKSNLLEITGIQQDQFDRASLLSGPILKSWCTNAGDSTRISGIAYFHEGEWLKYLNQSDPDKVVTSEGVHVGQISAMKNGCLELTLDSGAIEKIQISQIVQISSPRAYQFNIPVKAFLSVPEGEAVAGESDGITLSATSKILALSAIKRDPILQTVGDDTSSLKLTALWAGISAVEIAQFIPLAIMEGPIRRQLVRQYHSRINLEQQYANLPTTFGTTFQNSTVAPGANPYQNSPIFGIPNFGGSSIFSSGFNAFGITH